MTSEEPERHPDQALYWRRLRQLAFAAMGLLALLHAAVLGAWVMVVAGRFVAPDPLGPVTQALVWADVVVVLGYVARDGVQTLLERWGKP